MQTLSSITSGMCCYYKVDYRCLLGTESNVETNKLESYRYFSIPAFFLYVMTFYIITVVCVVSIMTRKSSMTMLLKYLRSERSQDNHCTSRVCLYHYICKLNYFTQPVVCSRQTSTRTPVTA